MDSAATLRTLDYFDAFNLAPDIKCPALISAGGRDGTCPAPTIHAGFGCTDDPEYPGTRIRLEIWNCGALHVCLERG